ncbi:hypothetical protein SAMN05892883_2047 [Jatrophihabitans sp. GAS493]|uniref:hypothetical protein n=1 Tax=Jatrophihabitans sp. GAS493 TaxID=1907575 RepID=UPI000BB7781F|nr:hypothetical protein [Jatrophihabitans sp. GAS493]SOD72694.1 hypothetical protein SAMN05892883_2047 [Jatrophihabitans sp. GAS493]
MIAEYQYGTATVRLDADAEDGVLLMPDPGADVADPMPLMETLADGTVARVGAGSIQEQDWNEAVGALYAAGYGLAFDGESIGTVDGMAAYAIAPLDTCELY